MGVHLNFRKLLLIAALLGLTAGQNAYAKTSTKKKSAAKPSVDKTAEVAKAPQNSDTSLGGLYVYVDEEGVPHYSLQPLDERYVLFSNAGPVMDKDIKLAVGKPEKKIGKAYFGDVAVGMYGSVNTYNYGTASYAVSRRLIGNPYLARYEATIIKYAARNGVDVNLVKAVMAAESGFNSSALSPKNAMGLMQVIPPTAARYGVSAAELMIPERNIHAGVSYLRDLSRMFKGQPELVIAAYNAGEGAVYKYNRKIPPYLETQNYVRKVMQYYNVFSEHSSGTPVFVKTRARKTSKGQATSSLSNDSRRSMQRINATVGLNNPTLATN